MQRATILSIGATLILCFSSCGEAPPPPPVSPAAPMVKTPEAKPAPATPAPPRDVMETLIWQSAKEVTQRCDEELAGAAQRRKELVALKGRRTVANTLVPLNRILVAIDRTQPRAELLANTHPKKAVREAAEACERRAKKFYTKLMLDRGVYEALKTVDVSGADAATRRFVKLLLRDYRRAGVDRDAATRTRLAAIQEQIVKLGQTFGRTIRKDVRTIEVAPAELAGLPPDFMASHKPGANGKIRLTTQYPDFFPVQSYAKREDLRRQLYMEYLTRGHPANVGTLRRILELRHEYATTLGYTDWAAYNAEDKMVKEKKVIADFIDRVAKLGRVRMKSDLKAILTRKRKDDRRAKQVHVWDRFYYVQQLKAERFGLKPSEVRPYFEVTRVKDGLLSLTQELFGLTFTRVKGAKVWHPRVETYDVFDGKRRIARFFLDLYPRKDKYGHAAEFPILSGIKGLQIPVASLVTNFPDPAKAGGGAALMEHNQVTTFFHEFGHLLHHLLGGDQRWVTQSGITCEWDFAEAPSQIFEEWAWDHAVLARFARHHQTGKPIPKALVDRMNQAKDLGKGVHVMRQMFYAALSFRYHATDPTKLDLTQTLIETQADLNPYPYEEGTAVHAGFGHLNGYSSMYYTYMWSLVVAKDLFSRFQKEGLLDQKTSLDYRRAILAPGGSRDAAAMVKTFLGRPYAFDAFERWLRQ